MLKFLIRRISVMIFTALVLTFVVFFLTNLPPNLEKLARSEGSVRMTDDAVASWIVENGHGGPLLGRYAEWLGLAPGLMMGGSQRIPRSCNKLFAEICKILSRPICTNL